MNRTKTELTHKRVPKTTMHSSLSEETRQRPSPGPDLKEAGSLLLGGEVWPRELPFPIR